MFYPLFTFISYVIVAPCFIESKSPALNVIHIIVDDLRAELSHAYGVPHMYTPNFDRISKKGVTFDHAYSQYAVCGPSRNSFLSGRRPDASRSWNMINSFREDHPDWTSLPGLFKKAGWNSFGSGKVYHPFVPPFEDGNKSWSPESLPFSNPCYDFGLSCVPCVDTNGTHIIPKCIDDGFGPGPVSTCWCEVEAVEDILTVDKALNLLDIALDNYKKDPSTGFYVAIGLHKPHLPWQAAKKYFDFYRNQSLPLALHKLAPSGMPDVAFTNMQHPFTSPWQPILDEQARTARIGYYAALSGVDEQLGRILDALDVSVFLYYYLVSFFSCLSHAYFFVCQLILVFQ